MMASHRKWHFRIWMATAIALPLLAISAYLLSPGFPMGAYTAQHISFPELKRSVVSEKYVFNIKKNYGGGSVLEVIQISKFNPASELITITYSKKFGDTRTTRVLGMMAGNTRYVFNLHEIEPPFSIAVKDTIRREILADIDF